MSPARPRAGRPAWNEKLEALFRSWPHPWGAPPAPPRPRSRRSGAVQLEVERLGDRVLPSAGDWLANAADLSFVDLSDQYQGAAFSAHLTHPGDVQLVQMVLDPGAVVNVAVDTAPYGGGLDSYLRVFQPTTGGGIREIASNDN